MALARWIENGHPVPMFNELDERSRAILKSVVDAYMSSGEPVGSRAVAELLGQTLSPATIRNVMADLEREGLLHAPHISAGRLPTEAGLRFFVDGILEIGDLSATEKASIEADCRTKGKNLPDLLSKVGETLSGLSSCAGLVLAPKTDRPLKQIDFVALDSGRILVILVTEDGLVENRVIEAPLGTNASTLVMAANYLNKRIAGRHLGETERLIDTEIASHKAEIDGLSEKLVKAGIAVWAGQDAEKSQLLVKGQSRLLEDVSGAEDIERLRKLFDLLETEEMLSTLVASAKGAEGVQIYIGAENTLFAHTGCSMIVSPYTGAHNQVIGAIGLIGPLRMNYARLVPMVDYTAKLVSRFVG